MQCRGAWEGPKVGTPVGLTQADTGRASGGAEEPVDTLGVGLQVEGYRGQTLGVQSLALKTVPRPSRRSAPAVPHH